MLLAENFISLYTIFMLFLKIVFMLFSRNFKNTQCIKEMVKGVGGKWKTYLIDGHSLHSSGLGVGDSWQYKKPVNVKAYAATFPRSSKTFVALLEVEKIKRP